MEYNLQPKQKSEVQFNGRVESEANWAVPFVNNIKTEFDTRFEKIKKDYEELVEEVRWNNMVYNATIKFKPVIGHIYHLYKDGDSYSLSLIAPNEWKKEHVGSFKFEYTGKWIKI